MHVQIVLESPYTVFTNLDFIRGTVVLRLFSTASIASIVVKLEGESRTRLIAPVFNDPDERPKPREEIHRNLYKLLTVFPPEEIEKAQTQSRAYTLNPGTYEYPFSFKIPFNNGCHTTTVTPNVGLSSLRLDLSKQPTSHIKATLPPTLTSYPGMAEIRYFLKVTVNRKEFYKENPRVLQFFNFLPIEPPVRPDGRAESYARRQHEFINTPGGFGGKTKSFANAFRRTNSADSASLSEDPPRIRVDARLPNPPIVTCNQDVPLRLIVKKLSNNSEPLYLQSLHIQLNGYTHIKAQELQHDETNSWILLSLSNMDQPLRFPKVAVGEEGEEMAIDPKIWNGNPLPKTVCPSFEACNVTRKYALEIHVGIGWGVSANKNQIILPLKHELQVYSGIAPPPALLEAMKAKYPNAGIPLRKPVKSSTFPSNLSSPASATSPSSQLPPQAGTSSQSPFGALPPGEIEPPPSYEDAIAEDLPPLDGPRSNYVPPPLPESELRRGQDEKSSATVDS